jgi:hypothetical protein
MRSIDAKRFCSSTHVGSCLRRVRYIAYGTTMETFKNWTLRDRQAVVPLSKLERAKGRILLTTKTVIHLALMLRLTELALKPSEAARIADVFTAAKGRWMVRSPA